MRFDTIDDYISRYTGTLITVGGELLSVQNVRGRVSNPKFIVQTRAGDVREVHPFGVDEEETVLDFNRSFYHIHDGRLYYMTANPERQWKQGFRANKYRYTTAVTDPRKIQTGGGNGFRVWDLFRSMVAPLYNTVGSVQGIAYVVSDSLAVDLEGNVFFKAAFVGVVQGSSVALHKEGQWIKDHLERLGIEYKVNNRSKKALTMKLSVPQLEAAGVDSDKIDQIINLIIERDNRELQRQREANEAAFAAFSAGAAPAGTAADIRRTFRTMDFTAPPPPRG